MLCLGPRAQQFAYTVSDRLDRLGHAKGKEP